MASHFEFEAIGTTWKIDINDGVDIPDSLNASSDESLLADIRERIDAFDKTYSRFRKDSLVADISRAAGEYRFPDDALPMMTLYKDLYDLTGGLVTPLVGRVLVDAGYDADYSLKPKSDIAAAPRWEDVMEYEHPFLRVKEPVFLDFGALGKGYLIDIVAGILRSRGLKNFTVDAGGDMSHVGAVTRVGLEDPEDTKKVVGVANLAGVGTGGAGADRSISLCGSAGNRRAWGKFHHIMNPKTAESPRHILGLWTVADNTMLADAMATALFFVGPDKLADKYRFECAILYADRSAVTSKGFPGSFFGA